MRAKNVNESIVSPALLGDFYDLAKELEKRKVPCKIQLSGLGDRYEIDVLLGFNFPDDLADEVFKAMEVTGVGAGVSADISGHDVAKSKIIAGGPRRYPRGLRY